jgi:hypothetical protein
MRGRYVALLCPMAFLGVCAIAGASIPGGEEVSVRLSGALHLLQRQVGRSASAAVTIQARFGRFPRSALSEPLGVKIALSPRIGVTPEGLPLCRLDRLRDASDSLAMRQCGDAVIGRGLITRRAYCRACGEFSVNERLIAFNGQYRGKPAILLHGSSPRLQTTVRTRFVSAIRLGRTLGAAGYTLAGTIPNYPYEGLEPEFREKWAMSTVKLSLHRDFLFYGRRRSYLTATCPMPQSAITVARATFDFEERAQVTGAVRGECGTS